MTKVKHPLTTYLKSVICPASKLHDTSLFVKREIFNIHLKLSHRSSSQWKVVFTLYLTGRVVDCWGLPGHIPSVVEGGLGR